MLKIIGATIVVATLSTGVQAANMGDIMMLDQNPHIMVGGPNDTHMIKNQCKSFKHRAHGKCKPMMNKHK